eukprot:scaffold555_cov158-Skeletonema_menzelii.AAC.4
MTLSSPSRQGAPATLKCPSCNAEHHAKTDVFGNRNNNSSDEGSDFGVLEIFGASAECSICLERMGGIGRAFNEDDGGNRGECDDDVIVTVKRAGKKEVNGTYKKDCNRYTRSARYNGKDVVYSIEKRVVNGKKMWVLCCRSEEGKEDLVDFYKATVNETCEYPTSVKWVSSLIGSGPAPRSEVSYFGR